MGILGMAHLRHYCIQLDFEAGKMRFLDPNDVNAAELGKAFPLAFSSEGQSERELIRPFIHHSSLIEGKGADLLIDTGFNIDGGMKPGLFRREVWKQKGDLTAGRTAQFRECVWDGETYTNLTIRTWPGSSLIGLRFLARHLVTFNFPKRTMYLKQTSIGPLVDEDMEAAMKFLNDLKEKGRRPGWTKNDEGEIRPFPEACSNSLTFNARKNGDSSIYHYTVARASKDGPWKLQRAWQTDTNEHLVKEYPVP